MYEVRTRIINDTGGQFSHGEYTNKPCPCITKNGAYQHYIEYYLTESPLPMEAIEKQAKPEYRVPLMSEIEQIPWNGYNVISTFSGCGGSCLGYRMAGFKVLWANEFIPIAVKNYKLNHPDSIVDERDIREVQAEEILEAIGMEKGDIDIMDGSPPCDSFSTAGKGSEKWGKEKAYLGKRQRTDDLFFEYARLLEGLQPKVFVAENVSGLVKGKAKGYFKLILQRLIECGYSVKAKLLDAQWLGVPQTRQRIIFLGIRNDLGVESVYPKPLSYRYTVRDALPWITAIWTNSSYEPVKKESNATPAPTVLQSSNEKQGLIEAFDYHKNHEVMKWIDKVQPGQGADKCHPSKAFFNARKLNPEDVSNTVTQTLGGASGLFHPVEKRLMTISELKRICAFPDDFQLVGTFAEQWARMGLSVPPVMMKHIAQVVKTEMLDKLHGKLLKVI